MKPGKAAPDATPTLITIVLVDDIAETRESIKKLLAFESDFKVIGTASNGREGVEVVKQLKPCIVIMDINMPDMDGLQAANLITKAVPTTGVIMMSVQDDSDYLQKAMLAGARFFLTKPVGMDQLYSTIRNVDQQYELIRRQVAAIQQGTLDALRDSERNPTGSGARAGHVLVVYSGQGGCGKTMIATSIASGLMKEGIKTLLVDGNLEFGDCGAFLNLKAQSTLVDLAANADDIDAEYFDSVVTTHNSGLKVLLSPPTPLAAAEIRENNPDALRKIIEQVRSYYDFIVIDMGTMLDAITMQLFEIADKVVLVTTPTLPALKNARLMLNLFDSAGFEPSKTSIVLNRALDKPTKVIPPTDKIQAYLKRPIEGVIPLVDESIILTAINNGVPVIASDRDTRRAPIAQLLKYSEHLFTSLMGEQEEVAAHADAGKKKGLLGGFFG